MNPYFHLQQIVCDYIDCGISNEKMNSPTFFKEVAEIAVRKSGSNAIKSTEHGFEPHGYTLLMVLENSSLSLHTWPEEKFISVEIFTCGVDCVPLKGLEYLIDLFKPRETKIHKIKRNQ